MYNDSNFTSDLINSYAWDTAIVFLQTFDNRENKTVDTKQYSRQNSLNTNFAPKGTNNLTENQNKICNIWDMSSNTYEWTTENIHADKMTLTHGVRGGICIFNTCYSSSRYVTIINNSENVATFRSILYL